MDVSTTASVPTVLPAKCFDPASDAIALRKAMKGMGTDEKAIINILSKRTSSQRHDILRSYNKEHDLVKDLKKDLSGKFEEIVLALVTPLDEYMASELHRAMDGVGTNEKLLIEVLCTRGNWFIWEIKKAYKRLYDKELSKDIEKETSDDLQKLLLDLCNCDREEGHARSDIAPELANKLYKAGEERIGTDEDEIRRILANYSFSTLRLVFDIYRKDTGNTVGEVIEKELGGDFKTAMLDLYNSIRSPAGFFAEALHNAMSGLGTKDRNLIRIVVSRSEIDMESIKQEYQTIYNKSLAKDIKGDTSGDYEKMLLALINA